MTRLADATAASGPPDEAALLAQLRAGDERAFETLVRTYGGRMLAVAQRLLSSESDAADAVQDAFLSAFRSIDTFAGGSRISTWLHRIVINAALMKRRTRQRRPEQSIEALLPRFQDDGHAVEPAVAWDPSVADKLHTEELREQVRQGIEELPESYQVILKLRDIEGLDTSETAELLGIEPNAVKVRLHRARQALRTVLDRKWRGARP